MGLPRFTKSLPLTLGTLFVFGAATAAQLSSARLPGSWSGLPDWIVTPPNFWLVVSAALAGLGAWASIVQLRAPEAATKTDMEEIKAKLHQIERKMTADPAISATTAEGFAQAAGELVRSSDPADRAAAVEIAEGDPIAAADRLMEELGAGKARNAERARRAARIYAPFAPSKAREAYEEAVQLDPTDVWSWIELGRLRRHYGTLADARNCLASALQHVSEERDRTVLHEEFGDLLMVEGELPEARGEYEAAIAIAERLAALEPGNTEWQRDLTVGYDRLGDVERASGNLGAARERYEAGLVIAERLAAREPGNTEWQRDLTVSYDRLGDVEQASGNLDAARERYEAGLVIRERLAAREPGNTGWQRDLTVSYERLGDVEQASGNLGAARERHEAGLVVRERLAALEPGNGEWQRDLFVGHDRMARIAEEQGDSAAALRWFGEAERVMVALVERWPDHPRFARDLAQVLADIARLKDEAQ